MSYYTLSYHRLYQLFGYKKNLNFEDVMGYLLYKISPREYWFSLNDATSLDGLGCSRGISYRDITQAKEKLPKYLGKPYSLKKMMRIEARLSHLDILVKEYKHIPWKKPWKKFKVWAKYNALRKERVSLQNAFSYLEYRSKACGLGVVAYRKKFMEYAEKFSEPARFFE